MVQIEARLVDQQVQVEKDDFALKLEQSLANPQVARKMDILASRVDSITLQYKTISQIGPARFPNPRHRWAVERSLRGQLSKDEDAKVEVINLATTLISLVSPTVDLRDPSPKAIASNLSEYSRALAGSREKNAGRVINLITAILFMLQVLFGTELEASAQDNSDDLPAGQPALVSEGGAGAEEIGTKDLLDSIVGCDVKDLTDEEQEILKEADDAAKEYEVDLSGAEWSRDLQAYFKKEGGMLLVFRPNVLHKDDEYPSPWRALQDRFEVTINGETSVLTFEAEKEILQTYLDSGEFSYTLSADAKLRIQQWIEQYAPMLIGKNVILQLERISSSMPVGVKWGDAPLLGFRSNPGDKVVFVRIAIADPDSLSPDNTGVKDQDSILPQLISLGSMYGLHAAMSAVPIGKGNNTDLLNMPYRNEQMLEGYSLLMPDNQKPETPFSETTSWIIISFSASSPLF